MPRKPKTNYRAASGTGDLRDSFQTPAYALEPLLPYLRQAGIATVWESAHGAGLLGDALLQADFDVIATDILTGHDYFTMSPPPRYDAEVTNVPFSHKYRWLEYACQRNKPFALLMPSDMLFAGRDAQPLIRRYDVRLLVPDKRIDFKTPHLGWADSSAQMHTSWVTRDLGVPERVTFCALNKPSRATLRLWDAREAGQCSLEMS